MKFGINNPHRALSLFVSVFFLSHLLGGSFYLSAQIIPSPSVTTSLNHIKISPDGLFIVATGGDTGGDIWIFETRDGKLRHHIRAHAKRIENIIISPDGQYFITHEYNGSDIRVWSMSTGKMEAEKRTRFELMTMTFLREGQLLAVSGLQKLRALSGFDTPRRTHVISYFNFQEGKLTDHLGMRSDSQNPPSFLSESPDGKYIISANHSLGVSALSVWSAETGKEVKRFPSHLIPWFDQAYMTEDGKEIYAFKKGNATLDKFDVSTGKVMTLGGSGRIISLVHANHQSFYVDDAGNVWKFHLTQWGWGSSNLFSLKRNDIKSFAVNRDESWLASIHNDGAIRLWDMESQTLLLSLYPYANRPSCAMITPDDIYATQPKEAANDLIIKIRGEVVPIQAVDLERNRPDIILSQFPNYNKRLLKTYRRAYKERLMIAKKTQIQEPVIVTDKGPSISLLLEKDSSSVGFVELRIQSISESSPLKSLELVHNGVAQFEKGVLRLLPFQQKLDTVIRIDLLPGKNVLEVWSTNQKDISSRRIVQEIDAEVAGNGPKGPRLFLFLVGISDYDSTGLKSLKYARKDVEDVYSFFLKHQNDFSELNIQLLTDEQATKANIERAFSEFFASSQPSDVAFVYVSGHGILVDQRAYFVPYDFQSLKLSETGLEFKQLEAWMANIPAQNRLICFDACHSGAQSTYQGNTEDIAVPTHSTNTPFTLELAGDDESAVELLNELFLDFSPVSGATIIAAARSTGKAYEDPIFQNGIFTHFFIQGLESRMADQNRDGIFKVSEVREYIFSYTNVTRKAQKPSSKQENPYRDIILWSPGQKEVSVDDLFKK